VRRGSSPPLVGRASVTGSVCGTRVILFFIVFVMDRPALLSLSLLRNEDDTQGRVPMLPVARHGERRLAAAFVPTRSAYALTQLPYMPGVFGAVYLRRRSQLGLGFTSPARCA